MAGRQYCAMGLQAMRGYDRPTGRIPPYTALAAAAPTSSCFGLGLGLHRSSLRGSRGEPGCPPAGLRWMIAQLHVGLALATDAAHQKRGFALLAGREWMIGYTRWMAGLAGMLGAALAAPLAAETVAIRAGAVLTDAASEPSGAATIIVTDGPSCRHPGPWMRSRLTAEIRTSAGRP